LCHENNAKKCSKQEENYKQSDIIIKTGMKKIFKILIIVVPILFLVLSLGCFLYKLFLDDIENQDCLTAFERQDLPVEIQNITDGLCVIEYSKSGENIHIEVETSNGVSANLEREEWIKKEEDKYENDEYTLVISSKSLDIFPNVSNEETEEQRENLVEEIEEEENYQGEYKISVDEISRINTTDKVVVFTFDGGSGTQSLEKILEILDEYNLEGTFFLTGKWAESNSGYTRDISNAGHEIFNHTYSHPDLATVTDEEIIRELETGNEKISEITGETTKPFFRPPYGSRNLHIREVAKSAGYQDVYWTIDALDWKESTGTTAEYVKNRILDNLAPGNIYLMHIGDNITGTILEEVIQEITGRGYTIMSLYSAVVEYQ